MTEKESNRQATDALTFDTPPNRLTILRMLAVPLVVYFLSRQSFASDIAAAVVFCVAAITDYFDGYLARTTKSVTIFGKLMDPLADKFLVVSSLIMLQQLGRIHPYLVIVLICREMGITSLRALASAEGVIIAAGTGGKWKAAIQMVAIPFLIIKETLWGLIPCYLIGTVLMYISVTLSVTSASTYVIDFFKGLKEKFRARQQKNS